MVSLIETRAGFLERDEQIPAVYSGQRRHMVRVGLRCKSKQKYGLLDCILRVQPVPIPQQCVSIWLRHGGGHSLPLTHHTPRLSFSLSLSLSFLSLITVEQIPVGSYGGLPINMLLNNVPHSRMARNFIYRGAADALVTAVQDPAVPRRMKVADHRRTRATAVIHQYRSRTHGARH